jgi:filamentous hemagglutinin family protein
MNAKLNAPKSTPSEAGRARSGARTRRQPGALRPLALALASVSMLTPLWPTQANAQTLPTGMTAVQGSASIAQRGAQMTVTNSAQAILNWQSFSIGTGAAVHFNQPNASSQVLNRVLGNDPSSIFGRLSSNGQVWLLNPHGVVFGATARVDVAGLVASTLNLSDHDWMSRRAVLQPFAPGTPGLAGDAAVTNQGELRSSSGGRIVLVGSGAVRNEGLIEAPGGQVVLAAGQSVDLADTATPYIALRVQAPSGEALNLGRIQAGSIDLQAALVNQQGLVRATSLTGDGGRVELRAADTLNLAAGSQTLVTGTVAGAGARTGSLVADAGRSGTLWVGGEVRADAPADARGGIGGRVELLGRHIGVLDGAQVSANGVAGGGQVFVGGGLQGKDTSLPNAEAVYIAPGARFSTDAQGAGDGGRTIVWSNQATRAYGQFSARGGDQGGDGGFIETSGGWIDARPTSIDAAAPRGRPGEWLIDPNDLYIGSSGPDFGVTGNPDFTTTEDFALITVGTIRTALEGGFNVSLTTSAVGGSQFGDIYMNFEALDVELSQPVTLTLNAQRNIDFQSARISSASGAQPLSVVFNPALGGSGGVIGIFDSLIDVPGGDIRLSGAVAYDNRTVAVQISNSSLLAPGGRIDIDGVAAGFVPTETSLIGGIAIQTSSVVQARDINIQGFTQNDTEVQRAGVFVQDSTLSATGTLSVLGTGTSTVAIPDSGTYVGIDGVYLENSILEVVPGGGDPAGLLQLFGSVSEGDPVAVGELFFDVRDGIFMSGGTLKLEGGSVLQVLGSGQGPYTRSLGLFPDLVSASTGGAIDIFGDSSVELSGELALPAGADVSVVGASSLYFSPLSTSAGSPSSLLLEGGDQLDLDGQLTLTGDAPVSMSADVVNVGNDNLESTFNLSTGGAIDLVGRVTTISSFSTFTSTAPGDAIIVQAQGAGAVFENKRGPDALLAPQGRWLVYSTDPTDLVAFSSGGLPYDFVQLNADSATLPQGTGNGFLFSVAPVLDVITGVFTKVYDGTVDITAPGDLTVSGLLGNDAIGGSFSLQDANAGAGKPLQLGDLLDPGVIDSNGKLVYGYQLGSSFVGEVTPATLSAAGVVADSKVYDGSAVATVSGGSLSGLVSGEDLQLVLGAAFFDDANAGLEKAVTGSLSLADGSNGQASNYVLSTSGFVTVADITPRSLSVAGVVASDKVYDGTVAAVVSGGTLSGLVTGEDLVLSLGAGSFVDANVGTGKAVTGTATVADGSNGLASNYSLGGSYSSTGDITAKALTLSGVLVTNRPYDGTTLASVSGGNLVGLVSGEDLGFSLGTANFDDANAGPGKTVTGSATLADGSLGLASNYSLSGDGFSTTGTISLRTLSLLDVVAQNKVYDGSTAATISGGTLSGLVAGEDLRLLLGTGSFVDANAGTGKTVNGTAGIADGDVGLASNYTLSSSGYSSLADITPRSLSVAGVVASDKVYDGTVAAVVSGGTLSGLVTGEDLVLSLGAGSFVDANVGTGKAVTGTATVADGSNGLASNYSLGGSYSSTGDITAKALTLSGVLVSNKVYDGSVSATVSGGSLAGLVSGEDLQLVLGAASFDSANAGIGRTVTGTASVADGSVGLASNYTLPTSAYSATATIAQRSINLAGVVANDKVYDGTVAATVSGGSISGLVAGEDLQLVLGAASFDNANAGIERTVTGTAAVADGSNGLSGNYLLADTAYSAAASITPRQLTLSGVVADNKVYDGSTAASVAGGVLGGLVTGEDLSLTLGVGSFVDANAGTGKVVSGNVSVLDGEVGLASNYNLAATGFSTTANIAPRPVTVSGIAADDKVYDGTTLASVSGGQLAGLVTGQDLQLTLNAGNFSSADVGTEKSVTGSVALANGSTGLASNYVLSSATFSSTASITPAILTLLADPVQSFVGAPIPPLTGSVTGFVAGESLATATTGSLQFSTEATPASEPGSYPVFGSGLLAGNYVFEQAPQNATALAIVVGTVQPPDLPTDTAQQFAAIQPTLFPPIPVTTPATGRVLDALQAVDTRLGPLGVATGQPSFQRIARASMSQNELAALLAARDRFKKELFAEALERLATDPALADAPACTSVQQAAAGSCLMSEPVRELARAQARQLALVSPPAGTPPAPVPPSAPVQPPAAPLPSGATTPVPVPAPAAVPGSAVPVPPASPSAPATPSATIATPPASPEASPLPGILDPVLPVQRRVRLAAVPEIQRKVAVLIGNDRYSDARIPTLDNAANDARAVAATLQNTLGYETLVLENASRAEILSTMNRLALQLEPQDSLIIYYAGHGEVVEATGQGYWQPADAVATDPETWISNNDIGRLLAQFAPNQVALVSDSCFSGSLVGDERIRGININGDPQELLQRRAAVVMTSGGNEPVFDAGRDGHSPFAYNLMRVIEQVPNWRPGSNVFERVRFAVARELPQRPQYGASRVGGHVTGADYLFEQRQLEGGN